jgi:cytochrome d ubiquinol oxidase subunit I
LAIQAGWLTAEVGRQPYVVYPSTSAPDGIYLTTANGVSVSVQPFELVITLVLFFAVYIMLFVGWARVLKKFVSAGPVYEAESDKTDSEGANFSFAQTASFQNGEGVTGESAKAEAPGAPAQIPATTSEGGQQ